MDVDLRDPSNIGRKSLRNGCITLFYEKRREFSPFFKNSFNKLLLRPWRTSCISIHLVFHAQKSIFNHVKSGYLGWPRKGTDLTDTEVNSGKH